MKAIINELSREVKLRIYYSYHDFQNNDKWIKVKYMNGKWYNVFSFDFFFKVSSQYLRIFVYILSDLKIFYVKIKF